MKVSNVIQKAKIYILAGTMSIMPSFANSASKKSVHHSAHYGIKAGEKIKSASKDYTAFSKKTKAKRSSGKKTKAQRLAANANKVAASVRAPKARPVPVLDKNGRIKAFVKVYNPTQKGPLSGKIIMINSGHGGYNPQKGCFDPGAHSYDSKGKLIEEWYKNQNFAIKVAKGLAAKGAKVIHTQGFASSVIQAKREYKNANVFISLHCDILPKSMSGPTIIYKDYNDKKLANSLNTYVKKYFNWRSFVRRDVRNLGVLREVPEKPSVLVELGNMDNKNDIKNLDSEDFRNKFTQSIVNGVITFYKK